MYNTIPFNPFPPSSANAGGGGGNSVVKIITSTSRSISGGYITCFYTKSESEG